MSLKVLNVLCEGQTEERFVKKVLSPYLRSLGITVKAQLLQTNKKKDIRGGMISYQRANTDLTLWIKQHSQKTYERHYFTTMFDLYKLPADFPGYEEACKAADCYTVIEKLEEAFRADIDFPRFIPYIQLHEFEALVFCGIEHLLEDYPDMAREVEGLNKIAGEYGGNPERINNGPETAPSKRIIKAFESKHHYDKPKSGELVTGRVGIPALKEQCPHFREWVTCLEKIATDVTSSSPLTSSGSGFLSRS